MAPIILVLLTVRRLSKKDCGLKGHIGKSAWEITDTVTSAKFWTDIPVKQPLKKKKPKPQKTQA